MNTLASTLSDVNKRTAGYVKLALIILLSGILLVRWEGLITGDTIENDAVQNLRMAYNLARYDTLSLDTNTDVVGEKSPTNYREPLPPAIAGLYLKVIHLFYQEDMKYYRSGAGARVVKIPNLAWAVLLCISVFFSIQMLTSSHVIAAVGMTVIGWDADVNTLYTELPAAALVCLFSLLGLWAFKNQSAKIYLIWGVSAGMLALTKGAFLYVEAVIALLLGGWLLAQYRKTSMRMTAANFALFFVGAGILIAPWLARNQIYLGSTSITERGGVVLMIRALKNQMNWTEYAGSFYVWAPHGWARDNIGHILGFTWADLNRGGRLQRLNRHDSDFADDDYAAEQAGQPEKAISYYRQARAHRVAIENELVKKGDLHPASNGDIELRRRAERLILDHPLNHALATLPFLWRGAGFMAPLLLLLGIVALALRRSDMLVYMLPSVLMIAFYAVASHNITRYNDPVIPILHVLAIAMTWFLVVRAWERWGRGSWVVRRVQDPRSLL